MDKIKQLPGVDSYFIDYEEFIALHFLDIIMRDIYVNLEENTVNILRYVAKFLDLKNIVP